MTTCPVRLLDSLCVTGQGVRVGNSQREDMGLLEYQAMPSLYDVAHGDVLCTFSNRSAPAVRAGGMDRPSRTISHPAWSLSSSQPGGPPCWASPLAFDLIANPTQQLLKAGRRHQEKV
jgi:hypothetical protein